MSARRAFVGAVSFVVLLMWFSAGSAFAEGQWFINGTAFHGTETVSGTLNGVETLTESIGTNKTKVVLSCSEVSSGAGYISGNDKAGTGTVKLKHCRILEPSGCKVPGEQVSINPTQGELSLFLTRTEEEKTENKGKYGIARPENAEGIFDTLNVEGCAIEGSYKFTGSVGCEVSEEERVIQECVFTKANTAKTLKFGGNPAELEARVTAKLSGVNTGKTWSVKEL